MIRFKYNSSGRQAMNLNAHKDWVTQCTFSPDGHRIVSVSRDKTARIWDSHIGLKLNTFQGHLDWLTDCSITHDNENMVTASGDCTLKLWDIRINNWCKIFSFRGHTDWVSSCACSPVEMKTISGSRDKTVRMWDITIGSQLLCLTGHRWEVSSSIFSPDGNVIASGSWDRLVKLWDPRGGKSPLVHTFDGHIDWVTNLSFSGDGMYVASCSSDRRVNIWDMRTCKVLTCFKLHSGSVNDVCFYPNGQFVASCSDDRTVKIWDAFSGTELLSLTGHTAPVTGISWGDDVRYVISSSQDKTVKLWDIKIEKQALERQKAAFPIRGDNQSNTSVAYCDTKSPGVMDYLVSPRKPKSRPFAVTNPVSLPKAHKKRANIEGIDSDEQTPMRSNTISPGTYERKKVSFNRRRRDSTTVDALIDNQMPDSVRCKELKKRMKAKRTETPTITTSSPDSEKRSVDIPLLDLPVPHKTYSTSVNSPLQREGGDSYDSGSVSQRSPRMLGISLTFPGKNKKGHKRQKSLGSSPGKKTRKRIGVKLTKTLKSMKGDSSPNAHIELRTFLEENNLSRYEHLLLKAGFDGPDALQLLQDMTEDDLKEIGISKLGHRRMFQSAIQALQDDELISLSPRGLTVITESPRIRTDRGRSRSRSPELHKTRSVGHENPIQFHEQFPFLEGVKVGSTLSSNGANYFFDKVTLGIYEKIPVMIKFISSEFITKYFPIGVQFEIMLPLLQQQLENLNHTNILTFRGIAKFRSQYALVVTLPKINLVDWLESEADEYHISDLPLSEQEFLMYMCKDINAAHQFVASKRMIIGIICAQRVYLSYNFKTDRLEASLDVFSEILVSNLLCKVYNCKIPKSEKICCLDYGYCAPEVLLRHRFTLPADVWSFGVFVWELWSLGATPYLTILDQRSPESIQSFVNYICTKDSKKLSLNHNEALDILISQCFALSPSDRPSADKITASLSSVPGSSSKISSDE